MERPALGRNRIFVGTEAGEIVFDEVTQLRERAGSSRRPRRRECVSELFGNLFIDLIAIVFKIWRPVVILRRWKPILSVEVPAACLGFAIVIDEDAQPHALRTIEVLHDEGFLARSPKLKVLARGEKQIVLDELDAELGERRELTKRRRLGAGDGNLAEFCSRELEPVDGCGGAQVAHGEPADVSLGGKVAR